MKPLEGNTVLQTDKEACIRGSDRCSEGHQLQPTGAVGENEPISYRVFARCITCGRVVSFTRRNLRH